MTQYELAKMLFERVCKSGGSIFANMQLYSGCKTVKRTITKISASTRADSQRIREEIPGLANLDYDNLPVYWKGWFLAEAQRLIDFMHDEIDRDALNGLNLNDTRTISVLENGSHWSGNWGTVSFVRLNCCRIAARRQYSNRGRLPEGLSF